MTRLFFSLYLDEDVSALVAKLIRSRGFTADTTQDSAQAGKRDDQQLAYATQRGMALLTHNRADFEALAAEYAESGRAHCGVIIAVRRHPREIVRRLLVLLNAVTADEMDNQVFYI